MALIDGKLYPPMATKKRNAEVAEHIRDKIAGTDIAIPYNVVTPSVRKALHDAGVPMVQNENKAYYVDLNNEDVKRKFVEQIAVAHAKELIEASKPDIGNEHTDENSHQWLDKNGWDFRKANILTPEGKILEALLNIPNSRDGRKILYDINKINIVGDGIVPSVYRGVAKASNDDDTVSNEAPDVNKNLPNLRHSLADEDEVMSIAAEQDAYDTSLEALSYYEDLIKQPEEQIELYAQSFSESKINDFYAGLSAYEDHLVFEDPVLEEGRVRMARSRNDFMARLDAEWNDKWLTKGEVLDLKSVKDDVRNLIMGVMMNSSANGKYVNGKPHVYRRHWYRYRTSTIQTIRFRSCRHQ